MTEEKQKKTTSEKPVSLNPLNFKEALAGLLKVKLKEEAENEKTGLAQVFYLWYK